MTSSTVNATYTPFISSNQIVAFPNLNFEIYYLEAPLSILGKTVAIDFIDNLVSINGYHTGVGVKSTNSDQPYEFTFDMVLANGFVISSFIPTITENDELIWNDAAQVTLGDYIDRDYWVKSTYITTITSDDLIVLQEWILNDWLPSNPIYSIASGSKSNSQNDIFNPFFRPSLCDTFCYAVFSFLSGINFGTLLSPTYLTTKIAPLDRCIDYTVVPQFTLMTFIEPYDGAFVPVDFESEKSQIVAFYRRLIEIIRSIIQFDDIIGEAIEDIVESDEPEVQFRLIRNELFTSILIVSDAYSNFSTIYYRGYNGNQIQYWRLDRPRLLLRYGTSNMPRNYRALTVDGKLVLDDNVLIDRCTTPASSSSINSSVYVVVGVTILLIFLLVYIMTSFIIIHVSDS